jgi:asparagine synthase (glutamine-hydrolysing)
MCGITGIISKQMVKSEREATVQSMNNAIWHRGPDQDGFYSDANCTLAMRRLSIIDLKTGEQPIYSNDKKYLIFFNGEIYNYQDLKNELVSKGFLFHTNSDTEVLVNLYQLYGKKMLTLLRGMFAFCIYDIVREEYFFARDRFGEKPFFYYYNEESFIFSSEIFSLLKSEIIPRRLNHDMLGTYLRRSYVPEPQTLFLDIKSLEPGHFFILKNSGLTQASYFTVNYTQDKSIRNIEDAASFIKPHLETAIKRQMVSDVPVGAFLSGGIDSSTVVTLMQKFSSSQIQSFNVKFQTSGYDESPIARKVAQRAGTDHHEIVVENSTFNEEQFWKILRHTGLPFPDSSAIPTDIVTSAIVKNVKVALSGDGGDELFGGYDVFDWYSSIKKLKVVPSILRRSGGDMLELLNKTPLGNNKIRQIRKALNISVLGSLDMLIEMHALFDHKELSKVYDQYTRQNDDISPSFSEWSDIRQAMYYRVKYDLPLDMLVKVDRMSMSNSLEVRNPFLDPDLFEASTQLPDKFLRGNGMGKLVLREIMKDQLPEEVFNHPKSGFSIPMHDFKNDEFKSLAKDLILNQPYMSLLFKRAALEDIVNLGLNENKDSNVGSIYRKTHQLWSLMMLSGWIKMFGVEI